jgi:putative pyruvate formate lyase activating enzyme
MYLEQHMKDERLYELYRDCTLCPRACHVDRLQGERGYCRQTAELKVARAALHFWEEPCLSGERGSGTVFFSGCALGCVYCQNHEIAAGRRGKAITGERLAEIFLELQGKGAHNINLVTPDHFTPGIITAIEKARLDGLKLPIVWNTGSYASVEALRRLEGYVNIYLPDLKYMSSTMAKRYSHCEDYFQHASLAISEMLRQTGEPVFDEEGIMKSGVIVRHLLIPGGLVDSRRIIRYLHETFQDAIYISIMNQYTPMAQASGYSELTRKVFEDEYEALVDYAVSLGVENGFVQEGETTSESFIPDFDGEGV